MKRNRYIVLVLAAAVWATVAIMFATGALSGAHTFVPPSGPSPACLPTTLQHSASIAGTALDVSPEPETDTASPYTQISFLGVPVTDIQNVRVEGSRSGYHEGQMHGYYQGDGGSFIPYKPFDAGERVLVRAVIEAPTSAKRISWTFRVSTPYPTAGIPGFPSPPAPAAYTQGFISEPSIHPPVLHVSVPDRDPAAGDVMITDGPGPGQAGAAIYSPQGTLVWYDPMPKGTNALGLRAQTYEGQSDLTFWQGHILALGFGQGEDVVMNSDYQQIATVHGGNGIAADLHEFQIEPGNIAYITAYNVMRCDLSPVGGVRNGVIIAPAIQEIDMKTGLVRWEWNTLDHIGVRESHSSVPNKATPWDWFHLNSIDLEPSGNLLISGRSTWAMYQLARGSGLIEWRLGGTSSSFSMGPGTETAWQHDARMLPDGTITAFDDGSSPREHYQSRAVHIALDMKTHTARLLKAYYHPVNPVLADSQGNVQTLPDGNLVIGWGAQPYVSELSKSGQVLLDAHMPPGDSSYRAFRFPWEGHPLTQPSVASQLLATGDSTSVFASWNGATDVASWKVLAGETPGSLAPEAEMPDSGFESSVVFPAAYRYVAVQAIGSSGQLLGTSATVAVKHPG